MGPGDGPAAGAVAAARQIGATLYRNGLRPARYLITDDDLVVMASEMGVLDIPQEKIVKKWRLQPGKMFLIDTEQGRIIDDAELKAELIAELGTIQPSAAVSASPKPATVAAPAPEEEEEEEDQFGC